MFGAGGWWFWFGILTPHVLSEWMVEVCRFEVYLVGVLCSELMGVIGVPE